jgi:hypothetical protein
MASQRSLKNNPPKFHQRKIATQTLKYSDAGALIMGGMTKDQARALLGPTQSKRIENKANGIVPKKKSTPKKAK